ncbi:MAG: DEAD/DEAH box helicase, partial [Planctomycetota bacterium]
MSAPRNRTSRRPGRRTRAPRKAGNAGPIEPLHPVAEPPNIDSFHDWDLGQDVQDAIAAMGISSPTPIQALAIGPVLEGRDVIAKAETGTGKTLAFGAPMMSRIDAGRSSVLGLVLSPTRELAEQVARVLDELGAERKLKVVLIVGGEPMAPQVNALQAGGQVVVGTPGRVLDLMNQGFLSFPWTEYAILDEADKMLEIGFIDDVKKILEACNEERQTLLFSATFPPPLLKLAREYTRDPIEIATAHGIATVDSIAQYYLRLSEEDRSRALAILINDSEPDDVFLVFCDRRTDVDRLARRMERERFSIKALHGGYDQASRFRVMTAFRSGEVKALLATDVASRGLDVLHVTHVINFGVPRDISDYTHRIGRTGRAGRSGVAVTFVMPAHDRGWRQLQHSATFGQEEITSPRQLSRLVRKTRASAPSNDQLSAPPLRREDPRKASKTSNTNHEPSADDVSAVGAPAQSDAAPSIPFGPTVGIRISCVVSACFDELKSFATDRLMRSNNWTVRSRRA